MELLLHYVTVNSHVHQKQLPMEKLAINFLDKRFDLGVHGQSHK